MKFCGHTPSSCRPCPRQALGALPLSEEGVAAASAALDRADQERKKGVPMHLRKNAAQVCAAARSGRVRSHRMGC